MALLIGIIGITGKMGAKVFELIAQNPACTCAGGWGSKREGIEEVMAKCDLLIDFSSHLALEENLEMASKWRKPLLIGTTGHSEKGKEQMKEASRSIPILHSPNFSSGMRSSLDAVKKISDALGSDFKAEIIETHHKHKKDTPSGSALALKALMERQTPIQSIREGEVIGEHRILFTSPEEMIEIKHVVLSRNAFAKGAIQAALFLATQPVGFYE